MKLPTWAIEKRDPYLTAPQVWFRVGEQLEIEYADTAPTAGPQAKGREDGQPDSRGTGHHDNHAP